MTRVNIDILGISELKWTGMGEFTQMTIISTTVGKNPLEERVAIIVNKSVKCSTWCNLKSDRVISVHFQGKPFNITVIHVYAPASNVEEFEVEQFYEDLQDLLKLTPKNDVFSL